MTPIPLFTISAIIAAHAPAKTGALTLAAKPPVGHHFNLKAPMKMDAPPRKAIKPASATEHEIRFEVINARRKKFSFKVTLYVCDDANSYCVKQEKNLEWTGVEIREHTPTDTSPLTENETPTRALNSKRSSAYPGRFGFYINAPAAAFEAAKKNGKPLLVDFFGIWCPPCNALDEEVYPSESFTQAKKDFVLLKLDADDPVSWDLKSRYKVGGYPTVVFASADGDEISRLVGFYPEKEFTAAMRSAFVNRAYPFAKLIAKADAGVAEAAGRLGIILLERREWAEAVRRLKKTIVTPASRAALRRAEIGLLESQVKIKAERPEMLVALLEQTAKEFPGSLLALDANQKSSEIHAELKETEKRRQALRAALATARTLLDGLDSKNRKLAGSDVADVDLWSMIAGFHEDLGDTEQARAAYRSAARLYKAHAKTPALKNSRAIHLELAWCLWKSGETGEANAIYERFEKLYPGEFTFHYANANMRFKLKDFDAARAKAETALKHAYGDNRLRSVELLAKILAASGKKAEALELLRKTIGGATLPNDTDVRTHRYLNALRALEKTIAEGSRAT